ncbi:WD40 repeat-like protein [Athelia psychrophila]|uniref:WD40 repeat-like protein n=1 Tax=Athelia psychrophila TaxID=1759441 RepID=A0A166RZD3_9AGAM|nr:WD40 repeat-like protein [Fibularhizoctonia sp. CBS 109695]
MSVMTASSSKIRRQPHDVPLPTSPERVVPPAKLGKKRRSRKEKEPGPKAPSPRRADALEGEWDHAKAATKPWQWVSLTDSSTSKHPPIFTKDGNYFFAIAGSSIKVHSTATGKVVSTLSVSSADSTAADGRSDTITSAILNPNNAFQLITGSLGGLIRIWDFLDGIILQTISIEDPIFHLCAHANFPDQVFVAAAKPTKRKGGKGGEQDTNGVVLHVSLKPRASSTGSKVLASSDIAFIGKTRHVVGLSLSPSGAWLVAVGGHKAYVAPTSSLKSGFTKYVSPEALTCLAFHPSEDYFATGDDKGNIRLWYCLNDQVAATVAGVEKRAQTTTLHWHAHAVASLAFTANGAYLLSGGEESVLVIWQLHTGKKEFVPRLGAPLTSVAVAMTAESEEYLVGLADATYMFINSATLKVSRAYSRIKLNSPASYGGLPSSAHVPLAVHSATSTIILPSSHPSSLQIYAPSTSTLVSELEVSPSNKVSRRDEQPIEPSRVDTAVISASGEWMATVDLREGDDAFRGEIYLKLWRWDSKVGNWALNTRIDRPHGSEHITCAAFSPEVKSRENLLLVTTGNDRNVKIWRVRATSDKSGEEQDSWVPRSSFVFRGEQPTHVSWSLDGSLFSIAMGPSVNLYDAASNTLRRVLTTPDCNTTSSSHFIGRSGRYLVVAGVWDVVLWDLSTQVVRWHCRNPWPIEKVLTHPRADTFALLHCPSTSPRSGRHTTPITLFRTSSSVPYSKYTVPFGLLGSAWYPNARHAPTNSPSFSLVGITKDYSVVKFGDDVDAPPDEGSTAQAITAGAAEPRRTLFQDIFGASAFIDPISASRGRPDAVLQPRLAASSGIDSLALFDTPAYLMPPLTSLYDPLMDSFIKLRSAVATQPEESLENADEDVEMAAQSDDEAITFGARRQRVVNDDEMDMFIDLFKLAKVSSTAGIASRPLTNGINKPATPVASTPKTSGIAASHAPASAPKDTPTKSPLPNGKKSQKRRRPSDGA